MNSPPWCGSYGTAMQARRCNVPESVEAFTSLVVPVLQRRGLYRTNYSGPTFRDHLGLATPAPLRPAL
jgi:hypothetical protein